MSRPKESDGVQAVLGGWKEIAQYVGKGVRTVQRWEQEFGFPVRRPMSEFHKAVLALPEEIDAWVQSRTGTEISELQRLRLEVERLQRELERRDQRIVCEDIAGGGDVITVQ